MKRNRKDDANHEVRHEHEQDNTYTSHRRLQRHEHEQDNTYTSHRRLQRHGMAGDGLVRPVPRRPSFSRLR